MEPNFIDYIILAIVILSILAGLQQGFIKAITGMFSTLIAIIIGFMMYDRLIKYLNDYFCINSRLADIIREKFPLTVLKIDMPIINFPFTMELVNFNDAADSLAYFIMIIASFLAVFVISLLILTIITNLLTGIFSWGFMSWINGILGMLFVSVKNLFIIMVLIGLIYPVIELMAQMGLTGAIIANDLLSQSFIANILLNLFETMKAIVIE